MFKLHIKIVLLVFITLVLSNCTTTKDVAKVENIEQPLQSLLVGVTPDYPPIIFKQGGEIAGVEADLARMLATELGKPVKFVQLKWEKQITALLEGKIDIIMSGMSITRARRIRINFSDHYLKSGLVTMMRIEDAQKYDSVENIKRNLLNIGVVAATTSDVFVRKNFPNAIRIVALQKAGDAPTSLRTRSIDIFVHDAPSIMWLVSENEANVTALPEPLNEEYLAWGVRKNDEELLKQVNGILSKWKKDGTLNRILLRWLPSQYLERFD
ncbi:MAG: transporter substrate-binding domain-containing protein [Thermodesulfovibrionia bacterium]|nr:transporter substrate-binding domain-containing protein [Thermodesulfovibrionia bacterium]